MKHPLDVEKRRAYARMQICKFVTKQTEGKGKKKKRKRKEKKKEWRACCVTLHDSNTRLIIRGEREREEKQQQRATAAAATASFRARARVYTGRIFKTLVPFASP